jgi:hypothetical protein
MKSLWKFLLALIALIALIVASTAVFIANSKPDPIRYPSPNGFDDLLKAAALIHHLPGKPQDPAQLTQEERKWLVQSNSAALKLLREGLAKEIRVVTTNDMTSRLPGDQMSRLEQLADLLTVEVSVAHEDDNPTNMLGACLDLYALGSKGTRGGLVVHGLIGAAIRTIACRQATNILQSGNATLCRMAAKDLLDEMTHAPIATDYLANEAAWRRRTEEGQGIRGLLGRIISGLSGALHAAQQRLIQRFDQLHRNEAELLRDLAATAFRLEHQRAATNWAELVPEYLPEIPRNATNNAALPLAGL